MSNPINIPFEGELSTPPFDFRGPDSALIPSFAYSNPEFGPSFNRRARSITQPNAYRWLQRSPNFDLFSFGIGAFGFYGAFTGGAGQKQYKTATLSGDLHDQNGEVYAHAITDSISYAPSPTTGRLIPTHSLGGGRGDGLQILTAMGEVTSETVRTYNSTDPSDPDNGVTLTLSNPLTMDDLIGWAATASYDVDYQVIEDGAYSVRSGGQPWAMQSSSDLDGTLNMVYVRSRYRFGRFSHYASEGVVEVKTAMRWAEVTRSEVGGSPFTVGESFRETYSEILAKPYFDRWGAFHPRDLVWSDAGWQVRPINDLYLILADITVLGTRVKVRSLSGERVRVTIATDLSYFPNYSGLPDEGSNLVVVLPLIHGVTGYHETLLPAAIEGKEISITIPLVEILDADSNSIPNVDFQILYSQRSVDKLAGFFDYTAEVNTLRSPVRNAKRTTLQATANQMSYDTTVDEYSTVTGDLLPQVVTSHPSASTSHKAQTVEAGGQTDWHEVIPAGAGTSTKVEFATAFRIRDRVGGTSGDAGGIGGTSGAAGGIGGTSGAAGGPGNLDDNYTKDYSNKSSASGVSAEDHARTAAAYAANAASAKSGDVGYRPDGSKSASGTMGYQPDGTKLITDGGTYDIGYRPDGSKSASGTMGYQSDGSSSASGTIGPQPDGSSSASGTMGNTNGGI